MGFMRVANIWRAIVKSIIDNHSSVDWDKLTTENLHKEYIESFGGILSKEAEFKRQILGEWEVSQRIKDLYDLWLNYYRTTWNTGNAESLLEYRRIMKILKYSDFTSVEIRDAKQWAISQIPESWG